MAAPPLMRSLSTRTVKKLEKPRPLKTPLGQSKTNFPSEPSPKVPLQDLMILVENVSHSLVDKSLDENLASNVATMHSKLKVHGQQLETIFKDQLDRAFVIFRNGCQDDALLCTTRLHLLELVELRANQWSNCNNTEVYYSAKMAATDIEPIVSTPDANVTTPAPVPAPPSPNPPALGPGEVLKTSGKFPKPTRIPGKNYCKDEVVIRNSDSGKVMGIKGRRVHLIEEISETIISFQRVNPGAKERLVQITGPSEDKIIHARHLMEDTIRRNASPVREGNERERMGGSSSSLNSSASDESNRFPQPGSKRSALLHSYSTNDATLGEYKYTVNLGYDSVKITGTNYETVRNAKLVLEEYYSIWLQKNFIGDGFDMEGDVFMDPAQEMAMLRLNSVDSGLDQGLGYSPLYSIPQVEKRPVLGRSDSIPTPLSPEIQDDNIVPVTRKYDREFLIECAVSPHSKVPPPNWDQVVADYPMIAKKAPSSAFDPRAFVKRTTGNETVISFNQLSNEQDSD